MRRTLDALLGRICAVWVGFCHDHARAVVAVCALSVPLVLVPALPRLGLNSDEEALFSPEVSYAPLRAEFRRLFPFLVDPVVVVVESTTPERAAEAADALADALRRDPSRFAAVLQPDGGAFLEERGLLFLDTPELEELVDHLASVQPYVTELSRDPSLRGLSELLARAARAAREGEPVPADLPRVLERIGQAAEPDPLAAPLSWTGLLLGREPGPRELRRFILVQPVLDFSRLRPAEPTLRGIREQVSELGLDRDPTVRVRLTGVHPLSYEEAAHVERQARQAGLLSFLLVSAVLAAGLGSLRLVLAIVATLGVGLAWTTAFAAAAVGHLNLISVTFGVLFIGLSVDFGIHIGIHFRELLGEGLGRRQALLRTAREVGPALVLCAATTAAAFYAFLPTDFVGVGELGLIAGTGMFLSLLANLTFLPALLALGRPLPPPRTRRLRAPVLGGLLDVPLHHARLWMAGVVLVTLASGWAARGLRFDLNPLRVRDPSTESVQTFNDLLRDGMAFPWNLHVLARDEREAEELARRLEALPEVREALTLGDYVPEEQDEKRALLEDAFLMLFPDGGEARRPPPTDAERRAALDELLRELAALAREDDDPDLARAAADLHRRLLPYAGPGPEGARRRAELEQKLIGSLPRRLRVLQRALRPPAIQAEDLPPEIVRSARAPDGRVRIEVFPAHDLNDNLALERYVDAVTALAPFAFGEGLVIHESERAVTRAFREALVLAAAAVGLLLLLLWRNTCDALLALLPVGLAALYTAGASAALGLPLNFANVIVIPLLLGMGVDSGIHLVQRARIGPLPGGNLLRTDTARAVLFSALTTVASFGSLSLSSHLGMASLGRLLTLGIALILVANLLVLPVAVGLRRRREGRGAPDPA